jgi:hypothetical protein
MFVLGPLTRSRTAHLQGENVEFSRAMLQERGLGCARIVVVQKVRL